jgi:hypothetical protein
MKCAEFEYIVFPNFYMFKNENGWRWISRDATKKSKASFEIATQCLKDAAKEMNKCPNQ